jgi:hypothetical protein
MLELVINIVKLLAAKFPIFKIYQTTKSWYNYPYKGGETNETLFDFQTCSKR